METLEIEEFRKRAESALARIETAFESNDSGGEIPGLDQWRIGLERMDDPQHGGESAWKERFAWEKRRLLAALERMHHGKFGICCYCEDGIPVERLRADVAAPFCACCQQGIDAHGT